MPWVLFLTVVAQAGCSGGDVRAVGRHGRLALPGLRGLLRELRGDRPARARDRRRVMGDDVEDSQLLRALERVEADGEVDPQAAVACFNSAF